MKEHYKKWSGLVTALLGLLITITPAYLFPVCKGNLELKSGMLVHMKCFWTGRAAMILGLLILLIGILIYFAKTPETKKYLSLAQIFIVIALIFIPQDFVIGICAKDMMACHKTILFINICSALILLLDLIILIIPFHKDEINDDILLTS